MGADGELPTLKRNRTGSQCVDCGDGASAITRAESAIRLYEPQAQRHFP
jgi:hypothetical protein